MSDINLEVTTETVALVELESSPGDPMGTAAALIAEHVAATDPHPQYATASEAAAAAPVQSVNAKTGAVSLTASDIGADPTGAALSAVSAHTAAADPHPQYMPWSEADEYIRDTMGMALKAGENVTITVNDAADEITISAAGGSSGGAVIDDATTATDKVWSSQKVSDGLAGKADSGHGHSIAQISGLQTALDAKVETVTAGSGISVSRTGATVTVEGVGSAVVDITGASATLGLAHANRFIRCNHTAAQTITIPPQASVAWPDNVQIEGAQWGAGAVTFVAGSGVTLRKSVDITATTKNQYSTFGLKRVATNEWLLFGKMGAA